MEPFSKLLVALDGSERAEHAVPVAVALAETTGAPIELVTVAVHDDHVDTAREILQHAADGMHTHPEMSVRVGLPVVTTLLDHIRDDERAVFVMSTHARTAVSEILVGSVAEETVRRSPVPVVLVGPHAAAPEAGARYADVVACVDGSHDGERLLPVLAHLDQHCGMEPWLYQVVDAHERASAEGPNLLESNWLRRAADDLREVGVEAAWDVGHGHDRADAILRFAGERNHPIVAVATRGRYAHERLRAGSVTVSLARSSPYPVLVLGPSYQGPSSLTVR